ncbi:MAG: hypothetical protein ACRD1E_11175, partial [Terriglobales bacterium]
TRPPLSRALDAALSGRVLARQLQAQCSSGLPQACGSVRLYAWGLNRGILYGAQFALEAAIPEAAGSAPPADALLLTDRDSLPALVAAAGRRCQMAQLSRFDPPGPEPAPWLAVRIACGR